MHITRWIFIFSLFTSGIGWAGCSVTHDIGEIGQYDPATGSAITVQFRLYIICSEATSFTVTAGPSQNTGSITHRQLRGQNPSSLINYQLCTGVWGGPCNSIFGTPPEGNAITGNAIAAGVTNEVLFWALVYGDQPAMPGWHDDFIMMTVSP